MTCISPDCQKKLVKVINIISGGFTIAIGVLRFILPGNKANVIDIALSIYFIIFGIVIILSEFNIEFIIIHTFSFLFNYFGRALFLIFVGVLLINNIEISTDIGKISVAGFSFLIFAAIFSLVYYCSSDEEKEKAKNMSSSNSKSNKDAENVKIKPEVQMSNKV